jgi:inosine/xanthosine triphosphatase
MLVVIGSRNPVKINAVRSTFGKAFPGARYAAVYAPSGISSMPMSARETRLGAISRAEYTISSLRGADFGVGVEGGVERTEDGFMICGYVCVVDRKGRRGIGGGTSVLLPKRVERELLKGRELGEVVDELTGRKSVKRQEGALGVLTNNITSREGYFRMAAACALAPFLNKKLY